MNFNIARELMNERTRDMLAEASQERRFRALRKARRQHTAQTAAVQIPKIPDYVHELVGHAHDDLKVR